MESRPWVLIPAAGESKRFKDAGYTTPKPFLRIRDKHGVQDMMLTRVLDTLPKHTSVRIGVSPNMDRLYPLDHNVIIWNTIGQADTILQMLTYVAPGDRILVMDCDMLLEHDDVFHMLNLLSVYDMTVAVTKTFDPNASRVDTVPFPTRFVEKQPISEWGIVSARGFKSAAKLREVLSSVVFDAKISGEEPYLSMAMNHYLGTAYAHEIKSYTDWGTPERVTESGAQIV